MNFLVKMAAICSNHLRTRLKCPVTEWILVQNSIPQPPCNLPFRIWTRPVFGSSLYFHWIRSRLKIDVALLHDILGLTIDYVAGIIANKTTTSKRSTASKENDANGSEESSETLWKNIFDNLVSIIVTFPPPPPKKKCLSPYSGAWPLWCMASFIVGCWGVVKLGAPDPGFARRGPTKVRACKSILCFW